MKNIWLAFVVIIGSTLLIIYELITFNYKNPDYNILISVLSNILLIISMVLVIRKNSKKKVR